MYGQLQRHTALSIPSSLLVVLCNIEAAIGLAVTKTVQEDTLSGKQ